MATSTPTALQSIAESGHISFLEYLRGKFNDEEADIFFATFATILQGKIDKFCIDLDIAYEWLGYTQKVKAVTLLQRIKLIENIDFLLSRAREHKSPDKYQLKPVAFKKLLLAARTEKAKKAAEYFIKIEEAIPEFYCNSDNLVSLQSDDSEAIRRPKTKSFPIEQFTLTMTNQNAIVSAGYHETRDPQVYAGLPQNVKLPPNIIPTDATIIKFGYTGDAAQRFEAHNTKYGDFQYLDHFYCVNAPGAEQKIRNFSIVKGRLIQGLRLDGKVDHEFFYVTSQEEWLYFASEFKRICDELMQHYMGMERQRLSIQLAEAEREGKNSTDSDAGKRKNHARDGKNAAERERDSSEDSRS